MFILDSSMCLKSGKWVLVDSKNNKLMLLEVHVCYHSLVSEPLIYLQFPLAVNWAWQYFSFCNSNDISQLLFSA